MLTRFQETRKQARGPSPRCRMPRRARRGLSLFEAALTLVVSVMVLSWGATLLDEMRFKAALRQEARELAQIANAVKSTLAQDFLTAQAAADSLPGDVLEHSIAALRGPNGETYNATTRRNRDIRVFSYTPDSCTELHLSGIRIANSAFFRSNYLRLFYIPNSH